MTRRHASRWTTFVVRAWVAVTPVTLLASDAAAQGCAMCRTALGSADDPVAQGFYWSILFMMAAPYTIVASLGGWLVYQHVIASRRANTWTGHDGAVPEGMGSEVERENTP